MQKISINGMEFEVPDGATVSIVNGDLRIGNTVVQNVGDGKITIGGNARFTLKCDQNVVVEGDVTGGVEAQGNVACRNVTGGVEAKGNVECDNVVGGVEGNDVVCRGKVVGGIEAKNFSRG